MLFGIEAMDVLLILIAAVVLFGPEKLPQYSRKAARVFVYLRDIANNAKTTLRTELGPEYADLELKDLHPKAFLAKHLREEVALLEEAKKDLTEAGQLLKTSAAEVEGAAKGLTTDEQAALDERAVDDAEQFALTAPEPSSPYDPEAT